MGKWVEFWADDDLIQILEELKELLGYAFISDVIREAIIHYRKIVIARKQGLFKEILGV